MLLSGIYDRVDEELIGLNSQMLVKNLTGHEQGVQDSDLVRFNGIGQAFRYASVTGAMIGDVDVADRMRQILHINNETASTDDQTQETGEPHDPSNASQ